MVESLRAKLRQWFFGDAVSPATLRQVGIPVAENGQNRLSFANDYFDLFVWVDDSGTITEFHLCYEKMGMEKVFTWNDKGVLTHRKVDAGKQQRHMTAIYTPDGAFPKTMVSERFQQNAHQLDQKIVALVLEKIEAYDGPEI